MQVALALAVAEDSYHFEHRDLHNSNVLIAASSSKCAHFRLKGQCIQVATHGVQPTIIDFTLSRLVALDGSVAYFDLEADPEVFQGAKGNVQVGCRASTRNGRRNCSNACVNQAFCNCLLSQRATFEACKLACRGSW